MPTDLVHIERTKLLANALDRASTAALAVGVLGPVVTATYGFGTPDRGAPLPVLVFGTILWLSMAILLHVQAQRILGRLK